LGVRCRPVALGNCVQSRGRQGKTGRRRDERRKLKNEIKKIGGRNIKEESKCK
jgi:hypothetical protein